MVVPALRFELDQVPPHLSCPKCEQNLYLQHDGSCLTRDIAHQRETIVQALAKLDRLLLDGWQSHCRSVRIIVGGGLIRDQVLGQLHYYQGQGVIRAYHEDSPNRGAIIAVLRA
jgi:hypothetical protein